MVRLKGKTSGIERHIEETSRTYLEEEEEKWGMRLDFFFSKVYPNSITTGHHDGQLTSGRNQKSTGETMKVFLRVFPKLNVPAALQEATLMMN